MPYRFICYACGYAVISPNRTLGEVDIIKHYHKSHSQHFTNVIFDDTDEFIDLEFHKKRKELIVFVDIIKWDEYEEIKMIHKVKPLPKTKIL